MTDQIYYKIQYPIKKAISNLKELDKDSLTFEELTTEEIERVDSFVSRWENGGRSSLRKLIKKLRNN